MRDGQFPPVTHMNSEWPERLPLYKQANFFCCHELIQPLPSPPAAPSARAPCFGPARHTAALEYGRSASARSHDAPAPLRRSTRASDQLSATALSAAQSETLPLRSDTQR